MATFVSNKSRAFKTPEDPCDLPLNSKSLFHMKTYASATDSRAWAFGSNDRKQYIFELFAADAPKTNEMYIGKYINLHALMKTLIGNKDADIYYLQSQLKLLEAFLDDIPLSLEQKNTLENLRQKPLTLGSKLPVFTASSSVEYIYPNEDDLSSQNDILEEFNKKFQEQEQVLNHQKALLEEAKRELSSYKSKAEERDVLKHENLKLHKSLESIRNTKASSNNDLLLKAKINDLQHQISQYHARKLANLKMVRNDQLSIFPKPKVLHEIGATTSENYIDINKVLEERNILQETVRKLLEQMESLQRFDELIERQLPGRHDRCPGDHASQVCQTLPNLHVETQLKHEVDHLKDQLSHFEVKNLEFDRLCLRIKELQMIQREHEETKVKYNIQFLEQRTSITQNLNQIDLLNEKCHGLQEELQRYKKLQHENNLLSERCKNLQKIIENQQGKVRFLENCKSLVVDSESKINELKEELDKKCSIIKVSDDKLLTLQTQLRESINTLTTETTVLKTSLQEAQNRITGLLEQENASQKLIKHLHEEIDAKNQLLQTYEQDKTKCNVPKHEQERDNLIQQLRVRLLDLKRDNDRLTDMGSRLYEYIMRTVSAKQIVMSQLSSNNTSARENKCNCDNLFKALRQFQSDLNEVKLPCEANHFCRFQSRYKELQSLAKGQVHWLANGLRKCKEQVQTIQFQLKEKE